MFTDTRHQQRSYMLWETGIHSVSNDQEGCVSQVCSEHSQLFDGSIKPNINPPVSQLKTGVVADRNAQGPLIMFSVWGSILHKIDLVIYSNHTCDLGRMTAAPTGEGWGTKDTGSGNDVELHRIL